MLLAKTGSVDMKSKWIITYWDMNRDCACKIGVASYEEAMTKKINLQRKGHNNVQVRMR